MPDAKKSTTVRTGQLPLRAPLPVRWVAGAASRLAPGPTARLAGRLFLRTQRPRRPEREVSWLRSATPDRLLLDGKRLATWSWGDHLGEQAPVVLLAHGWSGRGSQLGAFATALVEHGVRAVTFDAPGHGGSEGSWTTLPKMGEAMLAVAHRVGPLAGVVAHSAGTAATTWALRQGLDTQRVAYLSPPGELGSFATMFGEALGLTPKVQRGLQGAVERRIGVRWQEIHSLEVARTMTVPLLVVHDHDDSEVPLSGGRELVSAWPGGRLVATRGLGHRRLLRDEGVIETVLEFVGARRRAKSA